MYIVRWYGGPGKSTWNGYRGRVPGYGGPAYHSTAAYHKALRKVWVEPLFAGAKALDAALRGDDWEASLGEFQRQRDAAFLPLYQETIEATQLRDTSPESLLWLRSAFVSPHFARALMYWLPTVLTGGLPPELQVTMRRLAGLMGAMTAQERGE